MNSHNLKSNSDQPESWFAKFFIGSMVSISLLTILLSFLPSSEVKKTSQIENTFENLSAEISVVYQPNA